MRFSYKAAALVAVCMAAASSTAAAQASIIFPGGCVPCSSCVTAACWQTCSPSCPITPDNVIVNGDGCRWSGSSYGPTAAATACAAARASCGSLGSSGPGRGVGSIGPTTLSQCSNIAMGACQQNADVWRSPCAREARFGSGACDASTFRSIYQGAMTASCSTYAQTVTGVTPGTNSWAPQPWQPRPGPVIVIGSSAPGGGVGSAAPGGSVGSAAPKSGRRLLRAA